MSKVFLLYEGSCSDYEIGRVLSAFTNFGVEFVTKNSRILKVLKKTASECDDVACVMTGEFAESPVLKSIIYDLQCGSVEGFKGNVYGFYFDEGKSKFKSPVWGYERMYDINGERKTRIDNLEAFHTDYKYDHEIEDQNVQIENLAEKNSVTPALQNELDSYPYEFVPK